MSLHSFVANNLTDTARVYSGNAAPTGVDGNNYLVGDRIENVGVPFGTAITPGAPNSWICVLGGTGATAVFIEVGGTQAISPANVTAVGGTGVTQSDNGFIVHLTIPFTAIPAGASPVQLSLFTPPAKTLVCGCFVKHSLAFTGGGLATMTLGIGVAGTATLYGGTAFNILQAAGATVFSANNVFTTDSWPTGGAVVATFTSTGAVPNAATAGSVDIYVQGIVARS